MPLHQICPYCQSKNTFISITPNPMGKRFCNDCDRKYDRVEERRLARENEKKLLNL
jgi:transposase-like protein